MYTFKISSEALAGGTFQPKFELREENNCNTLFHNFAIPEMHNSSELALEQARRHAVNEAKKMGLADGDFEIIAS